MREHWAAYNRAGSGSARPPRDGLTRVLDLAGPGPGRHALDLGAGNGVETLALLDAGWAVTAVDRDEESLGRLAAAAPPGSPLDVLALDLDLVEVLPTADLVFSGYTLPWVSPSRFGAVWHAVREAVEPDGWLAVDLFGDRDGWVDEKPCTFHTQAQVRALFDGLRIVELVEEDEDGPSYSGPKHWHVFHVIARRPQDGSSSTG